MNCGIANDAYTEQDVSEKQVGQIDGRECCQYGAKRAIRSFTGKVIPGKIIQNLFTLFMAVLS